MCTHKTKSKTFNIVIILITPIIYSQIICKQCISRLCYYTEITMSQIMVGYNLQTKSCRPVDHGPVCSGPKGDIFADQIPCRPDCSAYTVNNSHKSFINSSYQTLWKMEKQAKIILLLNWSTYQNCFDLLLCK